MNAILYIIGIIISLNHGLLIYGLKRMGIIRKSFYSVLISLGMIAVNIFAIISEDWEMLILGFTAYCVYVFFELIITGIKRKRSATLLIPINLLMIISSIVALVTEIWIVFVLSYIAYWTLSYFIGRKSISRHFQSQKV